MRFQLPQSIENAHISEVYRQLKDAWSSLPRGIVKFDFNDGDGQLSLRRVEPHSVIMRSGNAYLIGYDLALNT